MESGAQFYGEAWLDGLPCGFSQGSSGDGGVYSIET